MSSSSDKKGHHSPTYTPFVLARLLRPNHPSESVSSMATPSNPSPLRESVAPMSSLTLAETKPISPAPPDDKDGTAKSESTQKVISGPVAVEVALPQTHSQPDSNFVKGHEADDVFGGSTQAHATAHPELPALAEESRVLADDQLATPAPKHAPRADRVDSPITPLNAQGVLPPEACVFVANLSMARTDEELEWSCQQAFDLFGTCVVKVRRDRHKHPFAMVQYYNNEDASRAVQGAHDLVIDGRRIRTEPAHAKRSAVMTKVGGGTLTEDEARKALQQYGPIDNVYPTTPADARKYGCPEGLWVEFAYFLDFKDAVKYFNNTDDHYRLHIPTEMEARTRPSPADNETVHNTRSPRSSTDQKSIFLGNLPHDISEPELRDIFKVHGDIKSANIVHKPIHVTNVNTFAFIEFATSEEAERAVQQEVDIRGQRIRVEPKEYSARRHTRLQHYSPMSPYGGGGGGGGRYGYHQMNPPFGMRQHHGTYGFYHGGHDYGMQHRMNPYHQHHHNGYSVFPTPPASTRMPPRRNNMGFSGSPHNVPIFTPASLPPPAPNPFDMDQGDESNYGSHHHMYQGNC